MIRQQQSTEDNNTDNNQPQKRDKTTAETITGTERGMKTKKHQKQAENAIFDLLQLFDLQLSCRPDRTKTASEVIGVMHQNDKESLQIQECCFKSVDCWSQERFFKTAI